MARTGKFGREPRVASSLTSTLVSIARAQQQQEDQNLMDAWQKGGTFNGKPATDAVVLAYWHNRMNGIAKDDPLYETYKDAVTQYEYTIAESKMTAQYSQIAKPGPADDQKMASFYLNWAKKIPSDSEFYRVLQRDAGQFIRSAAAQRDANSKAKAEAAYKARQSSLDAKYTTPGNTALDVLTMLGMRGSEGQNAVTGNLVMPSTLGESSTIDQTTNISDMQLPGIDAIVANLNSVNMEPKAREGGPSTARQLGTGNPAILYHDQNGQPVTGVQIIARLRQLDPGFNGNLTIDYIGKLFQQQKQGLQQQIDLAQKTGHVSDMVQYEQTMAKVNSYGMQIAAYHVEQLYSEARDRLQKALADDSLLPSAKQAAIDTYRSTIGALADDPRIAMNDHMRSQLTGEANGQEGTSTLFEDLTGQKAGYTNAQFGGKGDVANLNSTYQSVSDTVAQTKNPDETGMVLTQGFYTKQSDGTSKFTPSTGGSAYGAVLYDDLKKSSGQDPTMIYVLSGDGHGGSLVAVVPKPITVSAKAPDGTLLQGSGKTIGHYIQYRQNGQTVTEYPQLDSNGNQIGWTKQAPWSGFANASQTFNKDGLSVVIPAPPISKSGYTTNGSLAGYPGFSVEGVHVSRSGATAGKVTNAGHVVVDITGALQGKSPELFNSKNPYWDSFSPTLLGMSQLPSSEYSKAINQLATNSDFQRQVQVDAAKDAGMTYDAALQTWTGGDSNRYQTNKAWADWQVNDAKQNALGAPNAVANRDNWLNDTGFKDDPSGWNTVPVPSKQTGQAVPQQQAPGVGSGTLPSDYLNQQSGNQFGALSHLFQPRSNDFVPAQQGEQGLGIKSPISLVVPSNPLAPPKTPSTVTTTPYTPPPMPTTVNTDTYQPAPSGGPARKV